jgi:hypothetical protein
VVGVGRLEAANDVARRADADRECPRCSVGRPIHGRIALAIIATHCWQTRLRPVVASIRGIKLLVACGRAVACPYELQQIVVVEANVALATLSALRAGEPYVSCHFDLPIFRPWERRRWRVEDPPDPPRQASGDSDPADRASTRTDRLGKEDSRRWDLCIAHYSGFHLSEKT